MISPIQFPNQTVANIRFSRLLFAILSQYWPWAVGHLILVAGLLPIAVNGQDSSLAKSKIYFHIEIVDDETGRGVPLVELETVNGIRRHSDSAGNIAFYEPDLMGQEVYFHVRSHGYEYPEDGFGYRGIRLQVVSGQKARIKLKRINLARRLYRITGAGIYRDTRLLGLKPPIDIPPFNAQVTGCDSVINALYGNKLYWFWGDTSRAKYPLGNFQVTGATTLSPQQIDPAVGFRLNYFQNKDGFVKQMAPVAGKGPTWIFGLFVTRDLEGKQRMVAKYEKIKPPLTAYERGLVVYNDQAEKFETLVKLPLDAPAYPRGQSLTYSHNDQEYVYFAKPFPFIRIINRLNQVQDPRNYESWTYFKTGTSAPRKNGALGQIKPEMLDRDRNGKLVLRWRKNTEPISPRMEQQMVQQGVLRRDECVSILTAKDQRSGVNQDVVLSSGSAAWNEYRKKWILIGVQVGGQSMLGEIWYAEADKLEGPWQNPTKIVTHDRYSFYNPRHHPYFDQEGGKVIFFEGTYTQMFSGAKTATPRYDYNQIMYQLDLSKLREPSRIKDGN